MPEFIEVDTAVVSARAGRNTRAGDGSITSGSESIKRVSGNDLVIYTSAPEAVVSAEPVVLTPIDLVSETLEASAASKWITEKVAEGIANRAGEKLFDNATGSGDGTAAAGKVEGSSARLEYKEEVNYTVTVNLGFFKLEAKGKGDWKFVWGSDSKSDSSGGKSPGGGAVKPAPSKTPSEEKPKETGKDEKPKDPPKDDKPKDPPKDDKPKDPPKDDKPKETGKDEKPKEGVSSSGGKAGVDEDKKPKPGGKHYTDPNETLPPYTTGAVEKFDDIMRQYLTTSFSDSTAATAWLQQEADDAGIIIKVSGNGFEVTDKLPDPAGVAGTLRGMGVHDEDMIRVGVYETNLALRTLDRFVLDIQGSILKQTAGSQPQTQPSGTPTGTTTPTSSSAPGSTAGSTPGALTPSAISFVPAFEQLVPPTFDIDKSVSRDVEKELKGLKSTALDDNLKPRVLLSMDHTSLSGISVQAQLTTEITTALSAEGHKPGVRIIPYTSKFAGVPGWQLEA